MKSEESSPPFFPWELVDRLNDCKTAEQQCEQQKELESLGWACADDGEWLAHLASGWLCNPIEKVFFHAERNLLVPVGAPDTANVSTEAYSATTQSDVGPTSAEGPCSLGQLSRDYEEEVPESDEESDLLLDLEDDLEAATVQKKGSAEGKEACEDRFVTRAGLPLGVVAGSTEGLCYFTAIYDGHAGSDCADYAAAHLHKNLLSCYRQLYGTVQRKRQEELEKQGAKKRKHQQASQWLQQLNQSADLLRPEERRLSVEVEALVRSCFSAFSITDKNYLGLSENSIAQAAGSTACVAIFFGPDERGALQLVTAHVGDSRAVLCRDGKPMRLTEDHKPNSPSEKKRIEAAGGQVASVQGVWRVLGADARGGRTVGLSTSRALGDLALKKPKPLVISNPTVHVYTLHFEKDAFLILASDGIFEVLSDEEVVGLILSRLPPTPEEASQLVIDEAVARGGADDKTCTVIYFKWRKDLFPPKLDEEVGTADSSEPLQVQHQVGDRVQDEQLQAASSGPPEAPEDPDEEERLPGSAEASDKALAREDKGEETGRNGGDGTTIRELQTTTAFKDEESAVPKETAEANIAKEESPESKPEESGGPGEEAAEGGTRRVRSSGIEEIAAITSSCDVEALIRKRKREQQLEAEAAAAAAAADAEEEDFDIFGAAAIANSPGRVGDAEDSGSD